jgi:ribosome biogenesis GTPase
MSQVNDVVRLEHLGWTSQLQTQLEELLRSSPHSQTWLIGRIVGEKPPLYVVRGSFGEEFDADLWMEIPGKWRFTAESREDFPSIGDWVAIEPRAHGSGKGEKRATLRHLFERSSMLARKAAGHAQRMQIIASNVDVACIVTSLNEDLNPRRIERYLAVAWDGGAIPVLLLSKADLCSNQNEVVEALGKFEGLPFGTEIIPFSSKTLQGMERIQALLNPGKTIVVMGSSGVGKSTLVNSLMGEEVMATKEIRESDAKGRHTTTSRHLFVLPSGAILIDTPGMREIGLWNAEDGIETLFGDLEEAAQRCRFTNCRHENEPGCAVVPLLTSGEITQERMDSWRTLKHEAASKTQAPSASKGRTPHSGRRPRRG